MSIISFLMGIVYTQLMLDGNRNIEVQNSLYISPINNLFFYVAGFYIYFNANFINKSVLLNFVFLFILFILIIMNLIYVHHF